MKSFDTEELIPRAWQQESMRNPCDVYNPSIVQFRNRILMAYRLDSGPGGPFRRRIAFCELTEDWRIVSETITPFSDSVQSGREVHHDLRFLVYQDRLLIHYYNNNRVTRPDQIYLVELDTGTLQAKGTVRPLVLEGSRRPIEKNWMLFEYENDLFAIYSIPRM